MPINYTLEELQKEFKVSKRDIGEYHKIDRFMMHFVIDSYEIEGVGKMSIMTMKAMLGLMKMTSIVITPIQKEMPLLSCDLVKAMGTNTAMMELYSTSKDAPSYPSFLPLKEKYSHLVDNIVGPHWYDPIRLKETIMKKQKGNYSDMVALAKDYVSTYLKLLKEAPKPNSLDEKLECTQYYVNTLIEKGGPAVDQFKKMIGEEKTSIFLRKYMFGSEE